MPSNATYKYNTDQIICTINGVPVTEGCADDPFVTIEPSDDALSMTEGMKGDVTLNVSPKKGGTITIRMLDSSPQIELFRALETARDQGVPIDTLITVRGPDGLTTMNGLMARSSTSYGAEVGVTEFKFMGGMIRGPIDVPNTPINPSIT